MSLASKTRFKHYFNSFIYINFLKIDKKGEYLKTIKDGKIIKINCE